MRRILGLETGGKSLNMPQRRYRKRKRSSESEEEREGEEEEKGEDAM